MLKSNAGKSHNGKERSRVRKIAVAMCLTAGMLCAGNTAAHAQDDLAAQIAEIRQQVEELQKHLEKLQEAQSAATASQEDAESLSSTVQQLKDAVEEPEGAIQTTVADVAKLKKIKVSGYVQARSESYQNIDGASNLGDNRTLDNRFYVRRGRFKITGQPTSKTVGVVQLDICGYDRSRVETKDLYLEYHPWGVATPAPFFVRFGQQNWPFGYVIERSSSAREVPERPKLFGGTSVSLSGYPSFNGLFPGERDKGIALFSTETSKLDWALGVFNGTGTKSGDPGKSFLESGGKFEDNNGGKTIVGRLRYPVTESLSVGASIFRGTQAVRAVSNAPAAVKVDQTRLGLDFQYYMEGASIKGEYVSGKEPYYSNTTITPNGTSGTNRTVSGWYVVGVKNLGPDYQAVAQYDVLDDRALNATFGTLSTWNLGLVRFLDEATKLKLFYEINYEERNSVDNNGLRVELITVF